MNQTKKHLLIIDIEATCDEHEDDSMRGANREMVELGAVKLDLDTLEEIDCFSRMVRPLEQTILTDFCRQLLDIEQVQIDQAEPFSEVARHFLEWAGADVSAWASWGEFDVYQWSHDAARHGLAVGLPWPHLNLKRDFGAALGMKRRGIGGAYAELGLDIGNERHQALTDARLVARLLRESPEFLAYTKEQAAAASKQSLV